MSLNISLLYQYHLSTWFLLPVTGWRKADFDPYSFVNVLISDDCTCLYVVTERCPEHASLKVYKSTGVYLTAFELASVYIADVQLYKEGKFSEFSDRLKGLILRGSELTFKANISDNEISMEEIDFRLSALFENYRFVLEEVLVEAMYDEKDREEGLALIRSKELLSKPKPSEFIPKINLT